MIVVADQLLIDFADGRRRSPIGIVAYGTLVRAHRFARIMQLIPEDFAYEALAIFRCMVEIQINLSWIRRDQTGNRAERFLKFEPLERLDLIKEMPDLVPPGRATQIVGTLEAKREETRSLFAERVADGRTRWAKQWAKVPNLRARLDELMRAEGISKVPFTYVLYRWASTVVHGGPVSIVSVLESDDGIPRASDQPLADPASVYGGAAISLLMVCSDAAAIGELTLEQRSGIVDMIGEIGSKFQLEGSRPPAQ